jgi:branched-chain amino acid transport system substrate-binding protein
MNRIFSGKPRVFTVRQGDLKMTPFKHVVQGVSRVFMLCCTLCGLLFLFSGFLPIHPANAQEQSEEPIRVASVFARTGIGAEENSPNYRIVRLAAARINAVGGLLGRPLEIVELDTMSTALGARQAALDAVQAGVVAVVGPSWSSQGLAMAPVLQQAGIPMIGATTTAPAVTAVGDFIFRACYTDAQQAAALARFAREDLGAARVLVVTIADDVYSEGLSSDFARVFRELGGTVVEQLRYLQDAMDFTVQVEAVRRLKPDLVFVAGYTRDSGLLLKQARGAGLTMPFLGGDGWTALEHYPHLDPEKGDNYYTSHWHPDDDSPATRRFVDLLFREFGPHALDMIDAGNANAYDAVGLVANAVRRAGSAEPAAIRDSLATTDSYPGVTGTISFKGGRDPVKSLVVLRITKGGVEFVKKVGFGQ